MKDKDKTKDQLISELVELRQRLAELEAKNERGPGETYGPHMKTLWGIFPGRSQKPFLDCGGQGCRIISFKNLPSRRSRRGPTASAFPGKIILPGSPGARAQALSYLTRFGNFLNLLGLNYHFEKNLSCLRD